jgi:dihydroxyacetone kinase-like predicted kinase
MTVGIAYVDGPRLARAVYAAADWVAAGREEINRINVFPVPDGDTGTNFSLTLRAVADALRALGDAPLSETARAMARAGVLGARGNSGMMLAHFLLGFAEALGERDTATAPDIARAIRQGSDRLYESLDDPREGTILTVAREAAIAAEPVAVTSRDIREFMTRLLEEGEVALARTPELMAVLKGRVSWTQVARGSYVCSKGSYATSMATPYWSAPSWRSSSAMCRPRPPLPM